jgi:glycerophosphoryl diester phosphodiesterase
VAPENTLSAFARAIELGADGVELDVQLSADGVLVVCHNFEVDQTSDGHGRIADLSLAELKQLDFGCWFGPRFVGERIPTLDEVFDSLSPLALVNIELKSMALRDHGLESAVATLVRRRAVYDRVIVSSFNPVALRRLRRLDPHIEIGLLYAPNLPIVLARAWLRPWVRPHALHPEQTLVDTHYMAWARRRGYAVNVWTVNEAAAMRRLIDLSVTSIITDYPDRLAALWS